MWAPQTPRRTELILRMDSILHFVAKTIKKKPHKHTHAHTFFFSFLNVSVSPSLRLSPSIPSSFFSHSFILSRNTLMHSCVKRIHKRAAMLPYTLTQNQTHWNESKLQENKEEFTLAIGRSKYLICYVSLRMEIHTIIHRHAYVSSRLLLLWV